MPTDRFSVLVLPDGSRAGKTFSLAATQGYPNARLWRFVDLAFDDFDDMSAALEELQDFGAGIVIRGVPVPGLDTSTPLLRRKDDHPDGGKTFQPCPGGQRWIMGDVDCWPNPLGKPADEAAMRALTYHIYTSVMPPAFHDVFYWFQWSNSMGLGDKADWSTVSVHFWVLLKSPLEDSVLEQWADTVDGLDPCVFRTVQPNYVARPAFAGGIVDPLGAWRSGTVKEFGSRERAPLEYAFIPPPVLKARNTEVVKLQQALWAKESRQFRHIDVARASAPMQRIAEIGVGGRLHNPIVASAASWITCCGASPDFAAWADLVRGQVVVSGHPQAAHRGSERYLRQVWDSARRKFSPLNPQNPPVPRELITNTNVF